MVIDFHIHSKYSFDCFLEPLKIVELARQQGLDGLAIADHDTMAGIPEFKSLAPDLCIIAGQEVSTSEGDILGIFLKEEIRGAHDAASVVTEIRRQGGLAILAHPFKWPHVARRKEFLKEFDAVEVFNARNNIPIPFWENFLCRRAVQEMALPFIAGSDAHEGFELGRAQTIFQFSALEATEAMIKSAILEKQVEVRGREVSLFLEIPSHFSRQCRGLRRCSTP